jgi:hypothetical protein
MSSTSPPSTEPFFAFDADSANGDTSTYLWATSTLLPGESSSDSRNCDLITPEIAVTATP